MKTPTISLCMIVRDEEEMLPRFFAAALDLWDELIVVDTGSHDGSVALARGAGAQILHHVWQDDFAAARNVGLAAATGDFILFLDADEMAGPALATALRAAIADPEVGAATLRMRNVMPSGHHRVTPLLRLFRRDDRIRFQHRVHEEIATSVRRYLGRTGGRTADLDAEVLHLGYARDRAAARNKKERDQTLLQGCLATDPRDFYSWFKLLELARFWNDAALGQSTAKACLGQLARLGPLTLRSFPFGGELIALAVSAHLADDPAAACRLMDSWAGALLPSAAFHLRRGELAELLGDAPRAALEFSACLGLQGDTANEQLATVRPLMGLSRLALAAGQVTTAWRYIERALAYNHEDSEAVVAAVTVCQLAGGDAMVRELIELYKTRYDDPTPVVKAAVELAAALACPAT